MVAAQVKKAVGLIIHRKLRQTELVVQQGNGKHPWGAKTGNNCAGREERSLCVLVKGKSHLCVECPRILRRRKTMIGTQSLGLIIHRIN